MKRTASRSVALSAKSQRRPAEDDGDGECDEEKNVMLAEPDSSQKAPSLALMSTECQKGLSTAPWTTVKTHVTSLVGALGADQNLKAKWKACKSGAERVEMRSKLKPCKTFADLALIDDVSVEKTMETWDVHGWVDCLTVCFEEHTHATDPSMEGARCAAPAALQKRPASNPHMACLGEAYEFDYVYPKLVLAKNSV